METPNWNFQLIAENNVYEPAEDTFLLLDTLESEMEMLKQKKPLVVMEMGSGSGIVITALSNSMKSSVFPIAVDINFDACIATKRTSHLNNASIDVVNSDLLAAFKLREIIDVIIFNPPYVQTEDDEIRQNGISRSWAGGLRGRRVLDRIIPRLSEIISKNGIFYLVAIDYNDIDEIIKLMERNEFDGIVLNRRQISGELLYILKFTKK